MSDTEASNVVSLDRVWDRKTITEPGIYTGITLDEYHNSATLFAGPHVSKSSLMHLAPPLGNPKKFRAYWPFVPDCIKSEPSKAMNFGSAVHALVLGDEVFKERFVLRPDTEPGGAKGSVWHSNKTVCKQWLKEQQGHGRIVITKDQLAQIQRMAEDAGQYELVKLGILNGRIERSMFWQDPETKIWLKVRPDVIPNDSGMYADLKTSSSLDADFLERQNGDNGYYLAAALTRMGCRALNMPFESYTLLYCLSKDYGDTTHRNVSDLAMDRGERVIRYCLHKIRHGLDTGEWPGAETYRQEERPLHLKPWVADRIDYEMDRFERELSEAAE